MKLNEIKETTFFVIIKYIYILLFIGISFSILFLSPIITYSCKKKFAFSNIMLLFFDSVSFLILLLLWNEFKKQNLNFIKKHIAKLILAASIVLFFAQFYVSYNIYFLTGWDVGSVIIPASRMLALGNPLVTVNLYFSRYPNNITLVWIFSRILKANIELRAFNSDLLAIITVNCLISSLSSFLTYKCAEKLINKKWAVLSWILYFLLIGTSPWVVITYSDPFALFLPILIFFLYTREFTGMPNILKWLLIGIISFMGYHIKPQVIIIFIAIIIIEALKFIFSTFKENKKKLLIITALISAFVLAGSFYKTIYKQTGFIVNPDDAFGVTHFAMMGLNDKRDGVYSGDDVKFSGSYKTSSARKDANIEVIKERLEYFGFIGYIKFLTRKLLVNYGDGTFAWSVEGNFYNQTYKDKNGWISPLLKSFYYAGSKNYNKTTAFEQAIWIGLIVSMLGLIFTKKQNLNNRIAVLMLSIIGLTVFELLFEARARYLYIYSPVYICLSVLGLKNLTFAAAKLKQNILK